MLSALLPLFVSLAHAGTCDAQLAKIGGLTPETVAAGFTDLAKCDKKVAEVNYNRYLEKATDSDALIALTVAAINADVWSPAWLSIGKIASYEAQDAVVLEIGSSCTQNAKVSSFLQQAYAQLKPVDYARWDDAIRTCEDPALWTALDAQVQSPPAAKFDEKYDTLIGIYTKKKKLDALPSLQAAAIKAGATGPFDALIQKMSEAASAELGSSLSGDGGAKLEAAMLAVAAAVPVEQARLIADQLANSGANAAAATLLPKVYGDRAQKGGSFLYGAVAIELGDCAGKKSAILHYAEVSEPGKRWNLVADLEPVMRALKPKLKGCTVDPNWVVVQSPEPVKSSSEAEAWYDGFQAQYLKDHADVKVTEQKEKGITLP